MLSVIAHVLVFLLALGLVVATVISAIRTFVLPRSAPSLLTRLVFTTMQRLFALRIRWRQTYRERDQGLELYAPLSLLSLPPVWLALVLIGYMGDVLGSWWSVVVCRLPQQRVGATDARVCHS